VYCLERNENEVFKLTAADSKMDKLTKSVKAVDVVNNDNIGGLRKEVSVAVGARVMLIANLDVSDGLANGVTGTVRGIVQRNDTVVAIQVEFDSENIGQQAKRNNPHYSEYPKCVSIARHSVCSMYGKGNAVALTRAQFPICLAFACTIHKVQGMTLDRVVISMNSRFTHGQAYVALSRVKSLQGLHLLDFDRKKIICNKEVSREMNRLRQRKAAVSDAIDDL